MQLLILTPVISSQNAKHWWRWCVSTIIYTPTTKGLLLSLSVFFLLVFNALRNMLTKVIDFYNVVINLLSPNVDKHSVLTSIQCRQAFSVDQHSVLTSIQCRQAFSVDQHSMSTSIQCRPAFSVDQHSVSTSIQCRPASSVDQHPVSTSIQCWQAFNVCGVWLTSVSSSEKNCWLGWLTFQQAESSSHHQSQVAVVRRRTMSMT